MANPTFETKQVELLIIGSGVAGAYAALRSIEKGAKALLVSKTGLISGSTSWAQGGIAFPISVDDVASHLEDTLRAGRGLSDPQVTNMILEESLGHLERLSKLGMQFDEELALEGGHSRPRVRHIGGDRSGFFLLKFIHETISGKIDVRDSHMVVSLRVVDKRVVGAWLISDDGSFVKVDASVVLLATGGSGQLYRVTTNPPEATGDGIALAFEAGATIRDIELAQFHPTALMDGSLISEACRGEGAILLNGNGERFMSRYDEAMELAPRDVVARAVLEERRVTGKVLLDLRPIHNIDEAFPTVFESCLSLGQDPREAPVEIAPAAHYQMGGVRTDASGRTNLMGLYAAGEVASTGLHGANRLASNSLLEGLVMGDKAVLAAIDEVGGSRSSYDDQPPVPRGIESPSRDRIKSLMDEVASVMRNGEELSVGLKELMTIATKESTSRFEIENFNLRKVGELVMRGAILRRESRGAHFRSDFTNLSEVAFHVDQSINATELVVVVDSPK
ncbi:MAG: FAD-binding protein [Actinomycetota bacterium]|nr:FAD-binding protein [Actinomycetota bacterium]